MSPKARRLLARVEKRRAQSPEIITPPTPAQTAALLDVMKPGWRDAVRPADR